MNVNKVLKAGVHHYYVCKHSAVMFFNDSFLMLTPLTFFWFNHSTGTSYSDTFDSWKSWRKLEM